jgi:hypothetical protein
MKAMIVTASALAALATLALAAPASAQVTGSLGYSAVDADDATLGAITGRLGWRSGYFGVEGEVSGGISDDTVAGAKVELKHQFAGYGVLTVPMNENFDLFARVGYGQTKIEASAAGFSASGTENSFNYGAGAQYFFDGKNGIRGDYTRMDFENGGGDADVWSLSYVRRF